MAAPSDAWQWQTYGGLNRRLLTGRSQHGVHIVGIDGRSGSGKSSLAQALAAAAPHTAIVHTDDLAWHLSFFGWADLLIEEILTPVRSGKLPLRCRPAAWVSRDRPGAIEVPAQTKMLLVEGVGACRRELRPVLDALVWVEVAPKVGFDRVLARGIDSPDFLAEWHTAEREFFAHDQPWTYADIVVDGESARPDGTVAVTAGPQPSPLP